MNSAYRNTVKQLLPAIGSTVHVNMCEMVFACTVLDAKNAYGKVRLQIQPVAGRGTQWIELERLREA